MSNDLMNHVLADMIRAARRMSIQDTNAQIARAIRQLSEREQDVLYAYYGMFRDRETLGEIAHRLDVTAVRVAQIRDRALRRIYSEVMRYR